MRFVRVVPAWRAAKGQALAAVHGEIAVSVILYALILGVWGVVAFFRHQEVSPSYRGALVIGEVLFLVQALLGVLLLALGHRPGDWLHVLYGGLIPLMLPFAYAAGHERKGRAVTLMFGAAALFIVGLAIRAAITAG